LIVISLFIFAKMAAPFSGEEFFAKRSIFSSLFGLKFGKQQTKTNASVPSQHHLQQIPPPPQQYVGVDQPCSSRTVLTQPISHQNTIPIQNHPNSYSFHDEDFEGRVRSLSDQLADTLLLTSHHASPEPQQQSILSPHDIYKEIVCECAHFDQQACQPHHQHPHQHQQMHGHNYYNPEPQTMQASMLPQPLPPPQQQQQHHHQQQQQQQTQNIPTYYQYSPSQIQYPIIPEQTNSPTYYYNCQNCQHGNTMDNETRIKATVIEELANKTSLEDLVKLVVAAVKDAGVLGKSDKKQESPEEILRRKRQQNNEAAARYRKRQREAKMNAGNELEKLTTRNIELKEELTSLQNQINNLKSCITSSQQHQQPPNHTSTKLSKS
jgi:hypothetical protein